MTDSTPKKGRQGFASMSADQKREIASKGGRASHAQGKAHEFTSEEAKKAGQLGGLKVSQDRAHMAEIGRIGGSKRKGFKKNA